MAYKPFQTGKSFHHRFSTQTCLIQASLAHVSIPLGAETMAGLFRMHRECHELHLPLELLSHLLINVIHHLTGWGERALSWKEQRENRQREAMPRTSLLQQMGFAGIS